jgi:hypothetical protein
VNRSVSPWVVAGVVLLALSAAAFFYLRPEARPARPAPAGMPPEAAAEMGRRMQEWQRRQRSAGAGPGASGTPRTPASGPGAAAGK